MRASLELSGLDGSNPLAYLAALGTLRALSQAWPERDTKMLWTQTRGAWRPIVETRVSHDSQELLVALADEVRKLVGHEAMGYGDNIAVAPEVFRSVALRAQQSARLTDRTCADFVAAFACETTVTRDSKKNVVVQDTDFRMLSGSGHQYFLAFARNIFEQTTVDHLERTLFHPWKYADPMANLNMRWDPVDDRQYALRWDDPSGPKTRTTGSQLGANSLAILGVPMLPVVPVGGQLKTTGFLRGGANEIWWTMPIWSTVAAVDVVRSLLALPELQTGKPDRAKLQQMGIPEVFRCRRKTVGKFRNFAPAEAT